MNKTKRIALYGLCIALAFVLSYLESLIPISGLFPGMKLGLTNLVVVFALYCMDAKAAFMINMVRIVLVAATFGNGMSLLFSVAGCMLSFVVMLLLKKTGHFSVTGVSVGGGVAHNIGQLFVAALVLRTNKVVWYFGMLCISGVVAGVLIGLLAGMVISRLKSYWSGP